MLKELTQMLNESENDMDFPYNRQEDESMPKIGHKRKRVLKLQDLNTLKRIRNKKREELAQDSVFVPILYGPDMSNPEGDMMGGGMPM